MGFMGTTHLLAARRLRGGRVRAIVTTDPRKARGDFRAVGGNFGGSAGQISMRSIRVHEDLDALCADPEIDLVDICLPSYLHANASIAALEAGKHVLVEKPVALGVRDAERMIDTARRKRRRLLVAQVLKFFPEFALLADAIREERWGPLLALHLRRVIARPDWSGDSWFADPRKSGGMVVDLHIHDTDFVTYVFGKPRSVQSSGLVRNGRVDFIRTTYRGKRGGPLVTSAGGWINAAGLPFEHGYDAFFAGGTVHYDSSRTPRPILYGPKGQRELALRGGDGFQRELQAAVDAVHAGRTPDTLSPATALLSLRICQAEERSARTGRPESL